MSENHAKANEPHYIRELPDAESLFFVGSKAS